MHLDAVDAIFFFPNEGLREKIDLAMTSEILMMRFSHYLGEFMEDEGFLQAIYQVGLQVEQMKALEKE